MDREHEKEILAIEREKNKNICWVCKQENKQGQYRQIRWPKPGWVQVTDAFVVRFSIFFCDECLMLPFEEMKKNWRKIFNERMGKKWVEKAMEKTVCLWEFF